MKYFRNTALSLFIIAVLFGCYYTLRPNPEGTDYQSKRYPINADDIDFLYDLTYRGNNGKIISEQEIFDRMIVLIDRAERYILLDMFLFNSYVGKSDNVYRRLAGELTSRLIKKKHSNPDIKIDFITDPVNIVYGGTISKELSMLKKEGVNVIYTDLKKMRDSNILYSPIWRMFFQWFGNSSKGGLFPHPFSESEDLVTLRSFLALLNFKANHRKVFLADHADQLTALVTSANPHDGSSAHTNVAFEIKGNFAEEIYIAENAIAEFSGSRLRGHEFMDYSTTQKGTDELIYAQLLTEKKIETELVSCINTAEKGDNINIGVFYLSKRDIVDALIEASERGVDIRLILDPNKDAFGREKSGIPNRQVASELMNRSEKKIRIRWYDTHGEQFHSKLAFFDFQDKPAIVILGSANFTRRNLENYNLELDIKLTAPPTNKTISEVRHYFERIWSDNKYTSEYSKYEDNSNIKKIWYRFLEATGFSTF